MPRVGTTPERLGSAVFLPLVVEGSWSPSRSNSIAMHATKLELDMSRLGRP